MQLPTSFAVQAIQHNFAEAAASLQQMMHIAPNLQASYKSKLLELFWMTATQLSRIDAKKKTEQKTEIIAMTHHQRKKNSGEKRNSTVKTFSSWCMAASRCAAAAANDCCANCAAAFI